MGKGDKRSKKGKLILGTFGVSRKARSQNKGLANTLADGATTEKKKVSKTKKTK
jgi:ribosomal small subunit protein bTHX